MSPKFLLAVMAMSFCSTIFAAKITTTKQPDKAAIGSVVTITSDKVPTYCDFREQIVNIGYDSSDNIIMACLKRK